MDKIEKYRNYIREILTEFTSHKPANMENIDEFERQLLFDTEHDHYQVLDIGWDKHKRTFGCPVHIDIKDGKIWVQQDWTDYEFVQKLLEKGVPKEDIVLGFHAPYKRPYTGFGVGDKAA